MNYDVSYFIKKFEAIPEMLWCVKTYTDKNSHCALGHCGQDTKQETIESESLWNLFWKHFNEGVEMINDGESDRYQQPSPKQRILAALYDIKKMQEPQPVAEIPAPKMKFEKFESMNADRELIYAN